MSQSTTPAPAPSSAAAPARAFYVLACIKKGGQRTAYKLRPADTFPGSFVLDKGDGTAYTVNLAPRACTCPGFSFAGHCKHADFLARFLPGLADVLDHAGDLTRQLATAQAALSVALA